MGKKNFSPAQPCRQHIKLQLFDYDGHTSTWSTANSVQAARTAAPDRSSRSASTLAVPAMRDGATAGRGCVGSSSSTGASRASPESADSVKASSSWPVPRAPEPSPRQSSKLTSSGEQLDDARHVTLGQRVRKHEIGLRREQLGDSSGI